MNRMRVASGLLLGLGAALLARPQTAVRTFCGRTPVPPLAILRVLGARQALQHAVLLVRPSRRLMLAGAGIDVLHALSMLAAAAVWPRYRRAELASAGVAAGSAVLAATAARRGRPPTAGYS